MKRMRAGIYPLLLAGLMGPAGAAFAVDDLGRLFTTAGERAQLDAMRHAAPETPRPVIAIQPQDQQSDQPLSELQVRGLVKRDSGRSTAWVNDSNSYEGDMDSPYRTVEKAGIAADQVTVKLPDGQSSVKMKVGQTFDPATAQIRDLGTEADAATGPAPMEPTDNEE